MLFIGKDQSTGQLIVASPLYAKLLREADAQRFTPTPFWMRSR